MEIADTEQTATYASTGGGGGGALSGKIPNFFSPSGGLSTQDLVDQDNEMYGDTFPAGAIGLGSQPTDGMTTEQIIDRDNQNVWRYIS